MGRLLLYTFSISLLCFALLCFGDGRTFAVDVDAVGAAFLSLFLFLFLFVLFFLSGIDIVFL